MAPGLPRAGARNCGSPAARCPATSAPRAQQVRGRCHQVLQPLRASSRHLPGTSPPTRRDNRARISPSCGRGIDQSQSQVNLDQVVVLVVDAQQDDFVDLDGDSLVGVTQADLNALAATDIHIDRTPCAANWGTIRGVARVGTAPGAGRSGHRRVRGRPASRLSEGQRAVEDDVDDVDEH